jgi:hypothetical protein
MTRRLVLCLVALAAAASLCPAAEPGTAEQVLEEYVKAIGGKKALLAGKTLMAGGALEVPSQGMKGKLSIHAKAPNLSLHVVQIEGVGEVRKGHDGSVAWSDDPFLGLRKMEGTERDTFSREADFYAPLNWKEHYPEVELLGKEGEGEETTYAVKMTPATGYSETRHFDAKSFLLVRVETTVPNPMSFLLVRVETTVPNPMGDVPVVQFVSDYQEVSGVLVPFRMETHVGGVTAAVTTLEWMRYNEPIDDSIFAMPAKEKAPAGAEKAGQ